MFKFIKKLFVPESSKSASGTAQPTAPQPQKKQVPLWLLLLNTLLPTLCAIVYLCMGFFCEPALWHPGWLIFLLIPLYYSLTEAITRKNAYYFAFPVLAIGIYLFFGCINFDYWGSCWVVLVTIPLYYIVVNAVNKKNIRLIFDALLPVFCIVIYLLLGFLGNWWHPGWVIFFVIPLYYQTVFAVKKYKKQQEASNYGQETHDKSKVEFMTQEEYEAQKDSRRW